MGVHTMVVQGRRKGRAAGLALLGVLAACDFPTDLPVWDTLWVVPGDSAIIEVPEILSSEITVAPGGDEFIVDVGVTDFSRTLAEMCPPCAEVPGEITVPKPAFTATIESPLKLPSELITAELISGELRFALRHTFSFDPLRPGGGSRGYLILAASSDGTTLARDSLSGNDLAFPPGAPLRWSLPLDGGRVTDPITVRVTLHSPAGDPAVIHPEQQLSVEVDPEDVRVSDLRIRFASRSVASDPVRLEFQDIEDRIMNRVQEGALRVEIDNPLDVAGFLEVRIRTPTRVIVKGLELAAGSTRQRLPFTADELRSILGQPNVRFDVSGTLASGPEGTAIDPSERIVCLASVEATVRTGEGE